MAPFDPLATPMGPPFSVIPKKLVRVEIQTN